MRALLLPLLVVTAFAAPVAAEPRWTTNGGLTTRLSYTDNIFLTPSNEQSELILQVIPFVSAERQGARASARIAYGPSIRLYADESSLNGIDHALQANGEAEIVKNIFFLRASANANQALINPGERAAFDAVSNPDASTQFFTVSLAPSLRFPLGTGRYAQMSVDTEFSYIFTEDTADAARDDSVRASRTRAGIQSGPFFTRMPWSLSYQKDVFDTETNDGFGRLDGRVSYRFNAKYLGFLNLSYAEGEYDTANDSSGVGLQAGLTWTPSPRTSLTAAYGQAYFGDDSFLELQHRHKRTVWRARYGVSVQDFRRTLLEQEVIPATDAFGNPIRDPLSGQDLVLIRNTPVLTDDVFIRQDLTASVATTRGRTSARLEFDIAWDTYEQGGDRETTSSQVLFDVSRRLTPKTSANVLLRYWDYRVDGEQAVTGFGSDFDQYQVSLGLSRSLGPRTSAGFTLDRIERNADTDTNSYDENRVSAFVSVRLR